MCEGKCDCKGSCDCEGSCGCKGPCDGHCQEGERHGCCCEHNRFHRRYQTRDEEIAGLETYLKDLKLEVQAVEERLADLRK